MLSSLGKNYLLCQVLSPSIVPGKIGVVLLLWVGSFFFLSVNTLFHFWRSDSGGCATVFLRNLLAFYSFFRTNLIFFGDLIQKWLL